MASFSSGFTEPGHLFSLAQSGVYCGVSDFRKCCYRHAILATIITGAILLALSQKLMLDYSWKQILVASVLAPGFFYLVLFSAELFPKDMERSIESTGPISGMSVIL
ncbi:MAG TPA: hypothetical protein VFQ43_14190 [Nitrososphaera sp.]|nr:hypothetical protein [Nitrososphaera sp.]